jgi:peptide deformylase
VLVPVERHVSVALGGRDEQGEELRLELEGHAARVVQHELDHLDGVLIIDRTTPEARKEALAALRPQPVLGLR